MGYTTNDLLNKKKRKETLSQIPSANPVKKSGYTTADLLNYKRTESKPVETTAQRNARLSASQPKIIQKSNNENADFYNDYASRSAKPQMTVVPDNTPSKTQISNTVRHNDNKASILRGEADNLDKEKKRILDLVPVSRDANDLGNQAKDKRYQAQQLDKQNKKLVLESQTDPTSKYIGNAVDKYKNTSPNVFKDMFISRGEQITRLVANKEQANIGKALNAQGGSDSNDLVELDKLTDTERKNILYYGGKGDYKKVEEYYNLIKPELAQRRVTDENATMTQFAKEHPLLSVPGAIGGSLYTGGLAVGANAIQAIKNEITGVNEPTDTTSDAFKGVRGSQIGRQGITQSAYDNVKKATGSDKLANIASGLSDIGLSIGQSVAALSMGGTGLAMMSLGAAGDSTYSALQNGANPLKAGGQGAAYGMIEYATEKLPFERVLEMTKKAPESAKKIVVDLLIQSGIEGSEEMVSNIADNIVDIAIMKDQSGFQQTVDELIGKGYSEEQAQNLAFKQYFINDTLQQAAGGALSGFVMGGVGSGVGALNERMENKALASYKTPGIEATDNGIIAPPIEMNYPVAVDTSMKAPTTPQISPSTGIANEPINRTPEARQQPVQAVDVTKAVVNKLNEISKPFNEMGRRAFQSSYDGKSDIASYFGGFAKYYEAGRNGKTIDTVKDNSLTKAQKFTAFSAGQNDNTLANKKSGFVDNEFSRDMDSKIKKSLESLGVATNKKIVVTSDTGKFGYNGMINGDTIYIARDTQNHVMDVVKHEITHHMAKVSPNEYSRYRDYVLKSYAKNGTDVDTIIKNRQAQYGASGVKLSYNEASEELVADFTKSIMSGQESFDTLLKTDRTVAQRFVDSVRRLIRMVKRIPTRKYDNMLSVDDIGINMHQLEKAERLWTKALHSATKSNVTDTAKANSMKDYSEPEAYMPVMQIRERQHPFLLADGRMTKPIRGHHDAAFEALNRNTKNPIPDFMSYGNVRITGENDRVGVEMLTRPTSEQMDSIERITGERPIYYDFTDKEGKIVKGGTAPDYKSFKRIVDAYENYFPVKQLSIKDTGTVTEQSEVQKFRDNDEQYSLKDSAGNTLTPEQAEFFKDSKVRDDKGNLLVVYHGTGKDFSVFRNKNSAYYFSSSKENASAYGNPSAYYVMIKNPFIFNKQNNYEYDLKGQGRSVEFLTDNKALREDMINQGYDGAVSGTQYVAFSPNQIKSADPVTYDDNGDIIPLSARFKSDNEDIRYSLKDSTGNTLTPEQAEFFKDSKVRDDKGNLLVVYHGTDADFTVFEKEQIGRNYRAYSVGGFYFTSKKKSAEYYGRNGKVFDGYLNIKNPYFVDLDSKKNWDGSSPDYYNAADWYDNMSRELDRMAKEAGNDGIYIKYKRGDLSIAFDSNQFKSIDNKNPTEDDDINLSLKGEYDELVKKYGAIDKGEKPARDVEVPQQTKRDNKVRKFTRTMMEAEGTPDELVSEFEQEIVNGTFSYEPLKDQKAHDYATGMMLNPNSAEAVWRGVVEGNVVATKDYIVLGEMLYLEAANNGETKKAMRLAAEIAAEGTRAGQNVQALRLLKKMNGAGQLYYVKKTVDNLQEDLDKKKGKNVSRKIKDVRKEVKELELKLDLFDSENDAEQKPIIEKRLSDLKRKLKIYGDLQIPEELAQDLAGAKTQDEIDSAVDAILTNVASQVPSTLLDQWNAWRYLAMLGNPRTHIRNLFGNAIFIPAVEMKNAIAAELESSIDAMSRKMGKGGITRTKSIKGTLPFSGKEYAQLVDQMFEQDKDMMTQGGKMNPTDIISERRRIFKPSALEWARKKNFELLEKEDAIFLKYHYKRALTMYLIANNVDVTTIDAKTKEGNDTLTKASEYAINEAKKATYRDTSELATLINKLSRSNKIANVFIEGVLPFKKTPINILKRGLEYSPAGLLETLTRQSVKLNRGDITVNEYIDRLASGMTGTMIMALGAFLVSMGLLSAGIGDDDKDKFKELQGEQKYALKIGNKSYTVDWTAPISLPLFVGAEIMNAIKEGRDKEITFAEAANALTLITEPMFNLSMLNGMNNTINAVKFNTDGSPLAALGGEVVSSYFGQAIPTLSGQATRIIDPVRRTTYVDKNSKNPKLVDRFAQGQMRKIPFASMKAQPYIDEWGRTDETKNPASRAFQNLASPGYIGETKTSGMEKELERLFKETGDNSVFPNRASKYITVDHEKIDFTGKQYAEFATEKGQISYEMLKKVVASDKYRELSDDERIKVVGDVYSFASAKAKMAVSDYEPNGWISKAIVGEKEYGMNSTDYILYRMAQEMYSEDGNGSTNQKEAQTAIDSMSIPLDQKRYLWESTNTAWKPENNPY